MAKSALSSSIGRSKHLSKSLQLLQHLAQAEEAQGVPLVASHWSNAEKSKAVDMTGISILDGSSTRRPQRSALRKGGDDQ